MIAIIGSGFSGLGLAARLRQQGRTDFTILERADDLGGTWRDNDYPGIACDVPSHVYSYSFELNPDWSEGYASGAEIQAYLRAVADKHGLLDHVRFNHEVTDAAWDPEAGEWRIEAGGEVFTASYLVAAAGPLSEPSTPDLPGLERFEGASFHSARWDHDHDLTGDRVAVLGTGASAIQFVPQIQPRVSRLRVFQRTPPWIVPRVNPAIGRRRRRLLRRFPAAMKALRGALYAIQEIRVLGFLRPRYMRVVRAVAERHLKRQVPDPELRRRLTPDYTIGCKRILVSDDYYPSLAEPNVEVVPRAVSAVRERSVVDSAGEEHPVDTIIFGTGFEVTEPPIAGVIRDAEGRSLAEHWRGSMEAYKGTTVAGFPNLFFLLGPNTGLGHNSMVYMIESQINYVLSTLETMERTGSARFEVRREAQDRFNDAIQGSLSGSVWTAGACNSWYLDERGRATTVWPGWTFDFRRRLRRFDPSAYILSGYAGEGMSAGADRGAPGRRATRTGPDGRERASGSSPGAAPAGSRGDGVAVG